MTSKPSVVGRLAFLLAVLLPLSAYAWWNDQWTTRKVLTVDTTAQGADVAGALADVPVLLRLHTGNFAQFLNMLDGGADFRFLAEDDTTALKYHVERFDAVNELAFIWVRLPHVPGAAATGKIHMYFGNQAAPKADDAAGTYDTPTALVYHFDETAGTPLDKTAYGNNAVGFTALLTPASLIGGGARFSGDGTLSINDSPSLKLAAATGWTFSTWIKVDAPQTGVVLFDRSDAAARLTLGIDGTSVFASYTPSGGTAIETPRTTSLTPGAWHHLALVVGNGQLALYLDGVQTAAVPAAMADMTGAISVGSASDSTGYFTGEIDELQIAQVARSADWLKFAAKSQGTEPKLVAYGADETKDSAGKEGEAEGGHGGSFGIIFHTVFGNKDAIVEQVVIGICGIMAIIAIMVMVLKASFLMTSAAANRKFLAAFEKIGLAHERGHAQGEAAAAELDAGAALESLYGKKRFSKSQLYRVYRVGIDEVRKRRTATVGARGAALDDKAITTVKAALDATMVREGQRLNSQMVLLTIAISGGPFIGLLGTVVGVMVTFAAIAATGDVNIAAIAPGMAAALLATVAGLGVAIPSLFGYNYLGSRVKEISADMYVFADELIARIGETYGR